MLQIHKLCLHFPSPPSSSLLPSPFSPLPSPLPSPPPPPTPAPPIRGQLHKRMSDSQERLSYLMSSLTALHKKLHNWLKSATHMHLYLRELHAAGVGVGVYVCGGRGVGV